MAEIIDFAKIPRKNCSTCLWHDAKNGACKRPGGYRYDWRFGKCYSWKPAQKDKEG